MLLDTSGTGFKHIALTTTSGHRGFLSSTTGDSDYHISDYPLRNLK